jgi:hypothetical protein
MAAITDGLHLIGGVDMRNDGCCLPVTGRPPTLQQAARDGEGDDQPAADGFTV